MSLPSLCYYQDRTRRVVEESLEVALAICNLEMHCLTTAKIFDIFDQTLSSAFVLNTGYWPFYNTVKNQPLCVCGRYGLLCRHYRQSSYWMDLTPVAFDDTPMFSTRNNMQLSVLTSSIEVAPVTTGMPGYNMFINLNLQYKRMEKRARRRRAETNVVNFQEYIVFPVEIFCRYNLQREYYPAFQSVMFRPNPLLADSYGTYFPRLLKVRSTVLNAEGQNNTSRHTFSVPLDRMPNFTLMLQHVNLPRFCHATQTSAIYPDAVRKMRNQTITFHRATQTTIDEDVENELQTYQQRVEDLRNLWDESAYIRVLERIENSKLETPNDEQDNHLVLVHDIPASANGHSHKVDTAINLSARTNCTAGVEQTTPYTKDCYYHYAQPWPNPSNQEPVKKYNARKFPTYGPYRDALMGGRKRRVSTTPSQSMEADNRVTYASVVKQSLNDSGVGSSSVTLTVAETQKCGQSGTRPTSTSANVWLGVIAQEGKLNQKEDEELAYVSEMIKKLEDEIKR
ncbi:uncharacterized protein LOC132698636 [Cylas formicarius]|uniref:uncharacterized protein LOC132698636 n=1 Tax=Cylas formicarius TaxID=197179 RepID=UPI002958C8E5|nr:uncharacterized protein LOC132698636 [Cylas formicarius]